MSMFGTEKTKNASKIGIVFAKQNVVECFRYET